MEYAIERLDIEKKDFLTKIQSVMEVDYYEPLNISNLSQLSNNAAVKKKGNKTKFCSCCKTDFYQSQELWIPGC